MAKVLFKSIVFRLIDRVETFEDFGGIPNLKKLRPDFVDFVKERRKRNEVTFSKEHINSGYDKLFKSYEYVEENISELAKEVMFAAQKRSIKKCRDVIMKIPCVGDFFSCQILFDLLDCKVLGQNTDNQWVHIEKGAKAGLGKIFSPEKTSKQELKYARILRDLCNPSGLDGFGKIGLKFDPFLQKPLSLKNIEHALCGFDTYYKGVKKLTSQKNGKESICGTDIMDHLLMHYGEMSSKKANDGKVCFWCGTNCEINSTKHSDGSLLCDVCHKFEIAWRKDDLDYEEVENA